MNSPAPRLYGLPEVHEEGTSIGGGLWLLVKMFSSPIDALHDSISLHNIVSAFVGCFSHSLHTGRCDCLHFPEAVPGWYKTGQRVDPESLTVFSYHTYSTRRYPHVYIVNKPHTQESVTGEEVLKQARSIENKTLKFGHITATENLTEEALRPNQAQALLLRDSRRGGHARAN
ncbi:hypothetical protein EVAR_95786_1 [Eumeta japonica]|uniref:Uncharacterized protein n=1 Tax=Eumeta variegata TaxID=151549 RepID=A0A4C1W4V4_EUMVA|nr:hypothetical protein EVAR_95786_1 [Eumeta japonica]